MLEGNVNDLKSSGLVNRDLTVGNTQQSKIHDFFKKLKDFVILQGILFQRSTSFYFTLVLWKIDSNLK